MKFEEVLPYLTNGKGVRRDIWVDKHYIQHANSGGCKYLPDIVNHINEVYTLNIDDLNSNDWELYVEKVKCYPVLIKHIYRGKPQYLISSHRFSSLKIAEKHSELYNKEYIPIRLITDIPELIEEVDK